MDLHVFPIPIPPPTFSGLVHWEDPEGWAQSFIELDKAVVHVLNLISFLWLWFSFHLPSDG